ncbi:Shedu immune nuclease family protein [Thalassospira povalilytica]|uniref:Shedu immune nuclease family protein n=1 Tax=Thalassospira povalilytica TaxID=732237 RepID=UPI003AA7AE41
MFEEFIRGVLVLDDYENPVEGKTYVSPSLNGFGKSEKKVRIASKVINSADSYAFSKIKDEIVLRHGEGASRYIKATFLEDSRNIKVLTIQGYTSGTDKPHNSSFSFVGDEISALFNFIKSVETMTLEGGGSFSIDDDLLKKSKFSREELKDILDGNEEAIAELVSSSLTKMDITSIGYRKKQLETFERLLRDPDYFERVKGQKKCKDERLWQLFFEKNKWIFGYGLGNVYLDSLDSAQLEQVVKGYDVGSGGKRVDALLKSRGAISSLCFVEIKTHNTTLLTEKPYRSDCWAPSPELVGGIAQVQATISSTTKSFVEKLSVTDGLGNPTGEIAFNYQPKGFLVIGNLDSFRVDAGVNEAKFRSFELFRRNTLNPEIITFDELFERASFIVNHS